MAFKEANDAIASEQSIFSENQDCKSFLCVTMNLYVPIFWGLDAHGGRKLITCTHTCTHTSPQCAYAARVDKKLLTSGITCNLQIA